MDVDDLQKRITILSLAALWCCRYVYKVCAYFHL